MQFSTAMRTLSSGNKVRTHSHFLLATLLGPLLGLDHSMSAMLGVTESLFETAAITLFYQRYFP